MSVVMVSMAVLIHTFSSGIHAPCLLKLCIPSSNGIVRWWLFPEFGAELPLDNCTPTVILNNPVLVSYVSKFFTQFIVLQKYTISPSVMQLTFEAGLVRKIEDNYAWSYLISIPTDAHT